MPSRLPLVSNTSLLMGLYSGFDNPVYGPGALMVGTSPTVRCGRHTHPHDGFTCRNRQLRAAHQHSLNSPQKGCRYLEWRADCHHRRTLSRPGAGDVPAGPLLLLLVGHSIPVHEGTVKGERLENAVRDYFGTFVPILAQPFHFWPVWHLAGLARMARNP